MGKYYVNVPKSAKNTFSFKNRAYKATDKFSTDSACDVLAFHEAITDANGDYGKTDETNKFWKNIEAECKKNGGNNNTSPPSNGSSNQIEENEPLLSEDSGDLQGAKSVPNVVSGEDLSKVNEPDNPSPDEEPTRPPDGEQHSTHSNEQPQHQTESGDPVDIYNGVLYLQETDLEIPNTIMPLVFTRFYRGGAAAYGPFGWNWDHNYNLYVRELNNGNIALWRNLHEGIFMLDGTNFEPPRGVFERLTRVPGIAQAFEIFGEGGIVMRFERPAGWLDGERIPIIWMKDRHGNELNYSYGTEDKLVKVFDSNNRFFQFEYDQCGLLVSVEDHAGRKYTYVHNEETRHLICVTSPSTNDHPKGITKIYHYEKPFAFPELRHNILRIEDGDGRIYLENKYEQDPASWSYARVTEQLYGGFLFQFNYTQLQWILANPIYINLPAVRVEVMNPDFGLETYTFNYRGDLMDHRWRLNKDKSFRVVIWQYEYDDQGNLSVITKPDGSREINTFDVANSDPRMRNSLLQRELTSAIGFPSPSRIIWSGSYEPNYQLLIKEENEKNEVTRYRYDFNIIPTAPTNSGKLKEIIYPDTTLPDGTMQNCIARFEHNIKGQIAAYINPDGTREELVYGNAGNEISRLIEIRTDTGGLNIENNIRYDDFGYLKELIDGNGHSTKSVYNAIGQVEQKIDPAINGIATTTLFHYDADQKLIATEKPKGAYTGIAESHILDVNERDVLGYPTKYILSKNTPEYRTFSICNDYRGNPIEVNNPDESIVKRTIDERGLLVYEEQSGRDGKIVSSKNVYDRTGRLIREVNLRGLTTTYVYDGFGRVARINLPNGSQVRNNWGDNDLLLIEEIHGDNGQGIQKLLSKTIYEYDEKDRRTKEIISSFEDDPANSVALETSFFYDEMDRLTKIQDFRGAQKVFIYDNAGQLIREIDTEGNEEHSTYDRNGNIIRVDAHHKEPTGATTILFKQFTYDSRNRRTQVIEPDGTSSLEQWDDRNLLTEHTNLLGVSSEFQYNSFGEKVQEILDTGGLSITHEWSMDTMGRLVAYRDPRAQVSDYTFDSLGRVEKIEYSNGFSSERTYDSRSLINREKLGSGVVLEYSFDTANRLRTITNIINPASISSIQPQDFSYDGLNRIVQATSGANQVKRTYDSLNRLTSETTNSDVIRCTYDDIGGVLDKEWPDGRMERHSHNLNGVVANITQTNSGNLGSGNGTIAEFSPSGLNSLGHTTYKNNFNIEAVYDDRKRLVELTMTNGTTTSENLKYRYDLGNRKRLEAILGSNSKISLHDFDNKNRLLESKHGITTLIPNAVNQVENDAAIALVQGNSGTAVFEESFDYNNSDERLKYSETGMPDKNYTYSNGHRIQSDGTNIHSFHTDGTISTDGLLDFKIDSMGRVVQIEQAGVTVLEVEYDAFGRPSNVHENGKPKLSFNYFGNYIEQEKLDDIPFRQITIQPNTGVPIAHHTNGVSNYLLFDGRFNLIGLMNEMGVILETYRYKSFGLPTVFDTIGNELPISAFNIDPVFGGQRYFDSVGLYLSTRRFMNPVDGLFLSPDPKGYVDSSALYSYVAQNPIDYIDPNGTEKGSSLADTAWNIFEKTWNVTTNNSITGVTSFLEEASNGQKIFRVLDNYFLNVAAKTKNPLLLRFVDLGYRITPRITNLLTRYPRAFSPYWGPLRISNVNAFLAPLGVISNSMALKDSLFDSEKSAFERAADNTFYGYGLISSSIGTISLIGVGLSNFGLARGAGGFLLNIATKAGPLGLVMGAGAGGYAIGTILRENTGWGDASGKTGASVTKYLLQYDSFLPDFIDTGGSYAIGFTITVGGTVAEPFVWGGKKIGQGLNAADEFIMPKGRTLNPWTGIKSIARWENGTIKGHSLQS